MSPCVAATRGGVSGMRETGETQGKGGAGYGQDIVLHSFLIHITQVSRKALRDLGFHLGRLEPLRGCGVGALDLQGAVTMGFLDELESLAGGTLGAVDQSDEAQTGQAQPESGGVQALEGALASTPLGGLSGLFQHLQSHGLGDQISALTGEGGSQPAAGESQAGGAVAPDMIASALGAHLGPIAERLGLSPQAASAFIAQHLPAASRAI